MSANTDARPLSLKGQRLAVIGGTGLIGHNLLRAIADVRRAEADDTATYAVARNRPEDSVTGVQYVAASALDSDYRELGAIDLAIYVAGATSNYLADPMTTIRLGTEGVHRFLTHFATARRRVIVGSARIYGPRSSQAPLAETDVCTIRSPDARNIYDGAKLVSEALALGMSTADHPVSVVRLGNVYGPYSARSTKTAFTDMVQQAATTKRIVLTGPPDSVRNHVHGADAADGILRALLFGRGGDAYNIGSTDHLTNLELASAIAAAMPYEVRVEAASTATADHMVLAIEKARTALGFSPRHPAREHLPPSVTWLLENRS
jgi:nucleoside-diphosphate-sugar epimerase